MQVRSFIAVAFVALTLTACAVQGPRLEYSDFLPNTNEDPVWAHKPVQTAPADAAVPPQRPTT